MKTSEKSPPTKIVDSLGSPRDEGEVLIEVMGAIKRAGIAVEPFVVEDALSGMATYIELFFGRPSSALSLRISLLGPYAALGGASFNWSQEHSIGSISQMTLGSVGDFTEDLLALADCLRHALSKELQILERYDLAEPLPAEFNGRVISSLQNIEGRESPCVYDLLFQWED